MLCVSELRGLENFQAKHPEVVVVAFSTVDDKEGMEKTIQKHKLEALRVATGQDWQGKFGLSDAIPQTVVLDAGHVRVVHDSVMEDPVAYMEADLAALHANESAAKGN